jgi:uncharacterized protein YbaP (TraB family)
MALFRRFLRTLLPLVVAVASPLVAHAARMDGHRALAPDHRAAGPGADHRGPALWSVSDGDTTIYLFGTIHLLPGGRTWFNDDVREAFDASDTLVVETLPPDDPRRLADAFAHGYSDGLPPILERVPPADRPRLESALSDLGLRGGQSLAGLGRMETWSLQLLLTSARLTQLGYSANEGVDRQLIAQADLDEKAVLGFESYAEQISLLDQLAEADQRAMLSATLDGWSAMQAEVDQLVSAWIDGEERTLARIMNDSVAATPALAQRLVIDRNASWAGWIARRMAEPGTVFVAVGAGHLAGSDSLQKMLAARGLKVRRLN